jgi:hypothetical protein
MHWAIINVYKILLRKTEQKKILERPRHRWEHNIEVYLK